ncbi:MAG: PQQ-binding-like beta-propeller repeat protein, partial [Novipirellula sp. JB048]
SQIPFRIGTLFAILLSLGLSLIASGPIASGESPARPARMTPTATAWSEFHGAKGQGYTPHGSLPNRWSEEDYAWRHHSGAYNVGSPIIAEDRVIFLSSNAEAQTISVRALELTTGEIAWTHSFPHHVGRLHARNTAASSTPAADGSHIYCAWSDPQQTTLKCFDFEGHEIWSRDFGRWQSQHGFGTSPRVFGSLVLLFNSQQAEQIKAGESPGQSRMIAVDRETGETVWETPLKTTHTCYGVPAIFQPQRGRAQIIDADTGNGMFGIDAQSGALLWSLPVFSARCCSSPLVVGDLAIATAGSGGGGNHLVAVRIPKSKQEQPEQVYRIDRGSPYVPTPALKGDRLFMIDDKGIASCVEVMTGQTVWKERIGGNFGASPIIVDDKALIISLDGKATIFRASDRFEKLGEVDLGGSVGATPAYSKGRLLLRVGEEVRCLETASVASG